MRLSLLAWASTIPGSGAASDMQPLVADLSLYDLALELPAYVSLAAALACVLLLPLYISQRRDLERLHAWMEREPGHPQADIAANKASSSVSARSRRASLAAMSACGWPGSRSIQA